MDDLIGKSYQRNDRVHELLRNVEYRRIRTAEDRKAVFRLRHECYLAEGAITCQPEALLFDEFDFDGSLLFGVYEKDVLLSSIRIHRLEKSSWHSPAAEAFPEIVQPLIAQGKTLLDPNRLVVDREASRRRPELIYATLRIPFLAARFFNVDLALATVRAEHAAFYRRVLCYQQVADPRPYPSLIKPLGLMCVDFLGERDNVLQRYPFFLPHADEERSLI